jgi:hypothetical protein
MGATSQSAPPAPGKPRARAGTAGGRNWYIDEIVVAAFAIFGVAGAVFLPLRYNIPPITTSFLLATGLAALAYRFLGGIPGTSITVGALKLGGALAALVGIALIINNSLSKQLPQPHQVWQVSGQVVDDQGVPIPYFDPSDISIEPSTIDPGLQGKFQVMVTSWPDINGNPQFPVLAVSHAAYGTDLVDLNPNAKNDVSVTRSGQSIVVGTIQLHKLATYNPTQALKPAPPDAVTATPTPTPEQNQ